MKTSDHNDPHRTDPDTSGVQDALSRLAAVAPPPVPDTLMQRLVADALAELPPAPVRARPSTARRGWPVWIWPTGLAASVAVGIGLGVWVGTGVIGADTGLIGALDYELAYRLPGLTGLLETF